MKKTLFPLFFLSLISSINAQTIVDSLEELRSAVLNSNQEIILEPGTYNFTDLPDDDDRYILVSGSNNTITLTDCFIEVPVKMHTPEANFHISGEGNTIIGGRIENTYNTGLIEVTDYVAFNEDRTNLANGGKPHLVIAGDNTTIIDTEMIVRGSFPYGYGSYFGINGNNSFGLDKRGGIQVNSTNTIIDGVYLQMNALSHGIYIGPGEGATTNNTIIRNTTVEGNIRLTNDLLAERDGLMEANDFKDNDGNLIPADDAESLSEDGIRSYADSGSVFVENCTVSGMRSGIRLWLGTETKVTNTIAIDNRIANVSMNRNGIVEGVSANFTYGPALLVDGNEQNQKVDMTLIASPNAVGDHNIAEIKRESEIVFHRVDNAPLDTDEERVIFVEGDNATITNNTEYTIYLDAGATGNTITSCGPVTGNVSGNNVTLSDDCFSDTIISTCETLDAFSVIEAEDFCTQSGISTDNSNTRVLETNNSDWIQFEKIDFGSGANVISVSAATTKDNSTIEIRQGSSSGTLLGSIAINDTDGWGNYETFSANIDGLVGIQEDIYFVFVADHSSFLLNLDWVQFSQEGINESSCETKDAFSVIEAEDFCMQSGIAIDGDNGLIEETHSGDWIHFKEIDFSSGANTISLSAATLEDNGTIEIRQGTSSGTLLGSLTLDNTEGLSNYETFSVSIDSLTGIQEDIYFVFVADHSGLILNLDWIQFSQEIIDDNSCEIIDAFSIIEAEDFCTQSGISTDNSNTRVLETNNGDWIQFEIDFGSGANTISLSAATTKDNGTIEIRQGSATGTLLGSVAVDNTNGWGNYETFSASIDGLTGVQEDIYFVFVADHSSFLLNLDWIQFSQEGPDLSSCETIDAFSIIEAEDFCTQSGITTDSDNSLILDTNNSDWIHFKEIDFGSGANTFSVIAATTKDNGTIEIRQGSATGTLLGSVTVDNTDGWGNYETFSASIDSLSGIQEDIYFVFVADHSSFLLNLDWIQFSQEGTDDNSCETKDAFSIIEAEDFCTQSGITTDNSNTRVLETNNGDWIRFDINFGSGANTISLSAATTKENGTIEIRQGSATGTLLGSIAVDDTNGWGNYETFSANIDDLKGIQKDIYFVFVADHSSFLLNLDWIQFSQELAQKEVILSEKTLENTTIKIYPNPAKSIINLNNAKDTSLKLYDINGRLLLEKEILTDNEQINIQKLTNGTYYVQLIGVDLLQNFKLIKK